MPFLPYPGITARLTARLSCPVVLALMLFLSDGVRKPNFTMKHLLPESFITVYISAFGLSFPSTDVLVHGNTGNRKAGA